VTSAAPYYRKGRRKGEGVQIDLLVQTAKSVCVVEIKRKKRIDESVEAEVCEKLNRLKLARDISRRTALVYEGGVGTIRARQRFLRFHHPGAQTTRILI